MTSANSKTGLLTISRYFWPHLRSQRALMIGSMAALFVEVGLRLVEPWPLKFVFDHVLQPRLDGGAIRAVGPSWLAGMDPMTVVGLASVAVVVTTGLRAVAAYWQTIGFTRIGTSVARKVRERLFRHVQYLSLSFHTKARTGDLVTRVINDVGMLQDVAVTALLPLLAKSLVVAGMAALMLVMDWRLAVCAMAVLPLFWLRTITLTRRIRDVARKQRQQEGAMAATAAESITAIRTVQALSLEERFAASFVGESDRNLKQDVKGKRLSATLERTVDVLIALASALVLWYGARLVLRSEISPGDLLVFLAYLKSAYRPIQDFTKYTGRLAKAGAAGERVIDLLEHVPEVRDNPGALRAPAFRGEVRFENVGFAYEKGRPALAGIQVSIERGSRLALVGSSGAGKSTLVSLLLRLYEPTQGRVLVDGRDVREFTVDSVRAQVSVVLQDNLLFSGTIRENITCAMPNAGDEEILAAARVASAHEFIAALPNGYDTVVGERGVTLSHGQRQRIAIARAAIRRAPILILDEPTTGLDTRNERAVLQALECVGRNCTTIFISHDLRHAAGADQIVCLEGGRMVETGTHGELLAAGGCYAALWRMQVDGKSAECPVARWNGQ